jgi:hypothetical protein
MAFIPKIPGSNDLRRRATTLGQGLASTRAKGPGLGLERVNTGQAGQVMTAMQPKKPLAPTGPVVQGRRFVNLRDWMGLNQEQGQNAAKRSAATVEDKVKAATQAQNDVTKSFSRSVNGPSQDAPATRSIGGIAAPRVNLDGVSSIGDSSVQSLSQMSGFQEADQKTREAAQALSADPWRSGQYGTGERAFDNVLLGGAGANERMDQLRKKYSGLSSTWDSSQEQTTGMAKAAADARKSAADAKAKAEQDAIAAKQARDAELEEQSNWNRVRTDDKRTNLDDDLELPDVARGEDARQTDRITEETQAMHDNLYYEWLDAGRPPYDAWKESRKK